MPQCEWLIGPERARLVALAEIGQNRLAGDRGLAFGDQRAGAVGQIDVEARAESNEAEPLASADHLAFPHEADDAPRHQAGDLDHADASLRRRDDKRIALIVLARLVELGVDEGARAIGDAVDAARD